jgi:hypothetical protein
MSLSPTNADRNWRRFVLFRVLVNNYVTPRLAKKPEMIDYVDENGQVASLDNGGVPNIHPKIADDGTFKVQAVYLDKSPPCQYLRRWRLGTYQRPDSI